MKNLKHENGIVTFLMRTGKDLVRSQMTLPVAMGIINRSTSVEEKDNQIIVNDTYFFPTIPEPRKKQKESDE